MEHKNVIIAGSTKCGTTSLFRYLSGHPQICASLIKETRFFWDGKYDLPVQKINNKKIETYGEFFSGCNENQWRLEATPDYMYSSVAAEKINKLLPDCRIIFILRNPKDRIISWFKFSKQLGLLSEDKDVESYIKMLPEVDSVANPQYLRALEQGKYAAYLQFYFQHFKKENILVLFYKDLQNDPKSLMIRICDFLGIDNMYYENFDFKIFNPSLNIKNPKQFSKYLKLKKILRKYNNKLPRNWQNFVRRNLKSLDTLYVNTNSKDWNKTGLSSSSEVFLKNYYREDHSQLEKLLEQKIYW